MGGFPHLRRSFLSLFSNQPPSFSPFLESLCTHVSRFYFSHFSQTQEDLHVPLLPFSGSDQSLYGHRPGSLALPYQIVLRFTRFAYEARTFPHTLSRDGPMKTSRLVDLSFLAMNPPPPYARPQKSRFLQVVEQKPRFDKVVLPPPFLLFVAPI